MCTLAAWTSLTITARATITIASGATIPERCIIFFSSFFLFLTGHGLLIVFDRDLFDLDLYPDDDRGLDCVIDYVIDPYLFLKFSRLS